MYKSENIESNFAKLNLNNCIEEKEYRSTPTIFILGPTSIGKTKISLHLANSLNADIINSDVFSLYKTADVLTAKASKAEQTVAKHHMIDILELNETNYNVINYKRDSMNIIGNLLEAKALPIIVGGTNYYVESILFNKKSTWLESNSDKDVLIESNRDKLNTCKDSSLQSREEVDKIIELKRNFLLSKAITPEEINNFEFKIQVSPLDIDIDIGNQSSTTSGDLFDQFRTLLISHLDNTPPDILFEILSEIDPNYHKFLHKNDTRRVKNGIIYYFTENKLKSRDISKELIRLNYPNSLIINLNPVSLDDLISRIHKRVDTMLGEETGLREILEILNYFYKDIEIKNISKINETFYVNDTLLSYSEIKFDEGLIQAIGYKEFFSLYLLIRKDFKLYELLMDKKEKIWEIISNNNELLDEFKKCKSKLISNTLKYAKSQMKFIKKRILPFFESSENNSKNSDKILSINISDYSEEKFDECIKTAEDFIRVNKEKFSRGSNLNNQKLSSLLDEKVKINKITEWNKYFCDVCNSETNGDYEYKIHLKSNKHKKKKLKSNKLKKEGVFLEKLDKAKIQINQNVLIMKS